MQRIIGPKDVGAVILLSRGHGYFWLESKTSCNYWSQVRGGTATPLWLESFMMYSRTRASFFPNEWTATNDVITCRAWSVSISDKRASPLPRDKDFFSGGLSLAALPVIILTTPEHDSKGRYDPLEVILSHQQGVWRAISNHQAVQNMESSMKLLPLMSGLALAVSIAVNLINRNRKGMQL